MHFIIYMRLVRKNLGLPQSPRYETLVYFYNIYHYMYAQIAVVVCACRLNHVPEAGRKAVTLRFGLDWHQIDFDTTAVPPGR